MLLRRHIISALFLIVSALVFACNNKRSNQPVERYYGDGIYLDYRASADEEIDSITVRLQYRVGGPEGDAILPASPAQVEWDGVRLAPDSSRMNGIYYEKVLPLKTFGEHLIRFTNTDGKQYPAKVDFPIFTLKTALPNRLGRSDLILEIGGLKDNENVQVLLTDTSFYGRGIDRMYTVSKGKIRIPKNHLSWLKKGPVYLELIRDEDRILEHTPPGGGIFSLSYAIKREFILTDSL